MIFISRTRLIEALEHLELKDRKEHANVVGNAINGHGKYALKVLMNQDKLVLTEDEIYAELWVMLENGMIDENLHDQFIRDLRNNVKAKEMLGRYLRKKRRIEVRG